MFRGYFCLSTSQCRGVFSFCFKYVWRFDGFNFKIFMDVLKIKDFEGRILVADDSLCLSVFHL